MRALAPLLRELKLAWYRWALREIHPLHDDLPRIVLNVARLTAQRHGGAA